MAQTNSRAWSLALSSAAQDIAIPPWLTHRLADVVEYAAVKFFDVDIDLKREESARQLNVVAVTDGSIITATCGHLKTAQNDPASDRKTSVTIRPVSVIAYLSVVGVDRDWVPRDGDTGVSVGVRTFEVGFRDPSLSTLVLPWTTTGATQWSDAKMVILKALGLAASQDEA